MTMYGALHNASLARIPATALRLLGRLRVYASVKVRGGDGKIWVRWDEAGYEILRTLLPVQGAQFFEKLDDRWHLCGSSLPAFDIPEEGFQPLARVLLPAPQQTQASQVEPAPRVVLALKRSNTQRQTAAMLCSTKSLAAWAEMAPLKDMQGLQAAMSDNQVVLVGRNLPAIEGERFWGERLLCPLGWEPDPALPESALLEAIGVNNGELAIMRGADVEVVSRDSLHPLTRASVRLGVA